MLSYETWLNYFSTVTSFDLNIDLHSGTSRKWLLRHFEALDRL